MSNQLYIPWLNPVRFYAATPAVFDQYLTKHFDDYPFAQQILPWQEPSNYAQKWQNSDTIYLQFQSNFEPLNIDIIGKYGEVIVGGSFVATQKGANMDIPGMYIYEFSISLASIPAGCYHLKLSNGNDAELHMISEPFSVKEKWDNTVLLAYKNSRFIGDVVFETGIFFEFRVEGSFGFLQPGANIEAYEDQKANPEILSARPYRIFPLTIGGTFGVPDWAVDLFNLIWCCNYVLVDGKEFARSGEGQITFNEIEDYPMRGATIELREGINRGSKIVIPNVNTNMLFMVIKPVDTRLFGNYATGSSTNLVPIETAE
jgi:hypothetical protein